MRIWIFLLQFPHIFILSLCGGSCQVRFLENIFIAQEDISGKISPPEQNFMMMHLQKIRDNILQKKYPAKRGMQDVTINWFDVK